MNGKEDLAAPARLVRTELNSIQMVGSSVPVAGQRVRLSSAKIAPVLMAFTLWFASTAKPLMADEVLKWNEVGTKAASDSGVSGIPLFEARVYAITFAAIHDPLNGVDRRYSSYASTLPVTPGASPEIAVATAAHDVLLDQFSQLSAYGFASEQSFIEAEYTASLAQISDGAAKASGILLTRAADAAVLALRAGD